jgi:hypothetical protein
MYSESKFSYVANNVLLNRERTKSCSLLNILLPINMSTRICHLQPKFWKHFRLFFCSKLIDRYCFPRIESFIFGNSQKSDGTKSHEKCGSESKSALLPVEYSFKRKTHSKWRQKYNRITQPLQYVLTVKSSVFWDATLYNIAVRT